MTYWLDDMPWDHTIACLEASIRGTGECSCSVAEAKTLIKTKLKKSATSSVKDVLDEVWKVKEKYGAEAAMSFVGLKRFDSTYPHELSAELKETK